MSENTFDDYRTVAARSAAQAKADHTTTIDHLRIFWEGDRWALDGARDFGLAGEATDTVWTADTIDGIAALIPDYLLRLKEEGITFAPGYGPVD